MAETCEICGRPSVKTCSGIPGTTIDKVCFRVKAGADTTCYRVGYERSQEALAAARRILKFALYEEGYCEMTMADELVAAPLHHAPGCDNGPPHSCDCWVGNAWRAIAAPAAAPSEETKR